MANVKKNFSIPSKFAQRPNLKNLSRDLNLRRGSNMQLVPLKIVLNVSKFKPALNWNRFLSDLRRGSNLLNSDSGYLKSSSNSKNFVILLLFWIEILEMKIKNKLLVYSFCLKVQYLLMSSILHLILDRLHLFLHVFQKLLLFVK